MKSLIVVIFIAIVLGVLWALPLYLCVNLVLWVFHIPLHFTILQAIVIMIFVDVIHNILFKNKGGK